MLICLVVIVLMTTAVVWISGDPGYKGKLVGTLDAITSDSHVSIEDKQAVVNTIPQYLKGEEQTYLTLPEWYLVFNPNEYAHYLQSGNNPSDFPFMASINEYWRLYDRVMQLTRDVYPENNEYKTMLDVIGISTTAEFLIKGFYENTIGRISYWTASAPTPEDVLIQQAHQAYAELIYLEAWYKFPFADWLRKIWTDVPFFGANFIRKFERKVLFTLEFGFKSVYAKLIGFGAESAYDPSDGLVKMHVLLPANLNVNNVSLIDERVSVLHDFGQAELIISIPRWGGFSEIMPKLATSGLEFIEISGNDDMLVTVIADEDSSPSFSYSQFLFDSMVISPAGKQRKVYSVKVADLSDFIDKVDEQHLMLEHLFDY